MTKLFITLILMFMVSYSFAETKASNIYTMITYYQTQAVQDENNIMHTSSVVVYDKSLLFPKLSSSENNHYDPMGDILIEAFSLLGVKYKYGGTDPFHGMDCSGFIQYVYEHAVGIHLPRTVFYMSKVGKTIALKNIQIGDLLIFNTMGKRKSHIGMYIGRNSFIQSPRTGKTIRVSRLSHYWKQRLAIVKRVMKETLDASLNIHIITYKNIRYTYNT